MYSYFEKPKIFFFVLKRFFWAFHLKTHVRPHSSTWETNGFKELVDYAKCNRDSYEIELRFYFSYFSFLFS